MHRLLPILIAVLVASCDPGPEPVRRPPPAPAPPADPVDEGGEEEAAAPEPEGFTVFAAGDVYLGSYIRPRVRERGAEHPFARLRDVIEGHDVAFANLEAPISSRGTRINGTKRPLFRISREEAQPLVHSGLDVVSVANNHTMDYLSDSMCDTLDALDSMGIAHAGGGRTRQEAAEPAVLEVGGVRVVVLAYNRVLMPGMAATGFGAGMNPYKLERIVGDIERYKVDGSVVLVSVHWGEQYVETPTSRQVKGAHRMIEAGADAVLGHHPHCPQSVEVHRGRPIFYSLGNFVFGLNPPRGRHNIGAVLRFSGDELAAAEILPVHGMFFACDYQPYVLVGEEAEEVVAHVEELSARFGTRIAFSGDRGIIAL